MRISKLTALIIVAMVAFACQKAPVTPEVYITSEYLYFSGGTAGFKLSLSSVAETDVIVTLKAESETIGPERIMLPKTATILAGNRYALVELSVDDQGLEAGVHVVYVTIEGAGGANVSALTKIIAFILEVNDRTAIVSLSGPAEFKNGVAELELTPSLAPQADITVSLEVVDMQESWKVAMPSAALDLPETAVLPMGQKTPTKVQVKLRAGSLPPQDYQVVIMIADASKGAVVGENNQITLKARGSIKYSSQTNWKIAHNGRSIVDSVERDHFNVTFSGGSSAGYYIFDDTREYINTYSSQTDYFSHLVQAIMTELDGEDPYTVRTASSTYDMIPYRASEPFQITMLGCDGEGYPTGEYRMISMALGISDYAIEHYYDRWLGEWEVDSGGTWIISEADRSKGYYNVTGIRGTNYVIAMDLKNDGTLQLRSQKVASGAYLYGHFDNMYYQGYVPIAEAEWADDDWIDFNGLAVNSLYTFKFCMVHDASLTSWPVLIDFPEGLRKQ